MSSVDNNTTSNENINTPHEHDKHRGEWASTLDFYLASFGQTFGIRNITMLGYLWWTGSIYTPIYCSIFLLIFTVPIYLYQSALGQFSSTGFISVYRISPIFKGAGYMILIFNIVTIMYFNVYLVYPLLYIFYSFSTDLPWMSCNNSWNTENCTDVFNRTLTKLNPESRLESITSANSEFLYNNILDYMYESPFLSVRFLGSNIIVWIIIFLGVSAGINSISKATRCTMLAALCIFFIILLRTILLPNAMEGITYKMLNSRTLFAVTSLYNLPVIICFSLGSGCGTILSLASYNNIKTDIVRYSFIIPFSFLGMTGLCTMLLSAIYGYINFYADIYLKLEDLLFLNIEFAILPFFFGLLEGASMWCAAFFLMIFLLELNTTMIMVFAILTALFDEFIWMRQYKPIISLGLCIFLCFGSISFPNYIEDKYVSLFSLTIADTTNKLALAFLEISIIIWFYGTKRMQHDVEYMVGRRKSGQFFMLKYITPIILIIFTLFGSIIVVFVNNEAENKIMVILSYCLNLLPWVIVPCYALYKLITSVGTLSTRYKKSCEANDWYPANLIDRQQYEPALESPETSRSSSEENEE